jgi:hypothetical protein
VNFACESWQNVRWFRQKRDVCGSLKIYTISYKIFTIFLYRRFLYTVKGKRNMKQAKRLVAALFMIIAAMAAQAVYAKGQQEGGNAAADSSTVTLDSLLRTARTEIQQWDNGTDKTSATVYSLDLAKKDQLFQAVNDAGYYQVWSDEFTRDWELQRGVLSWCVPDNTENFTIAMQVSAVGEKTVHQYGFKPLPDVYFTEVENSTFGNSHVRSIAYGGGKFVASGENGKMAYSADGVTWATVENITFDTWSFAYGGGKFIAGGANGNMAYSADGVKWTAFRDNTFPVGRHVVALAYGGSKWVAASYLNGGADGRMAYSEDGITWTSVRDFGMNIQGIAYGGGRFVASGGSGKVAYSTDGVTWTVSASGVPWTTNPNGGVGQIRNIAYGAGKFVAVGNAYDGKSFFARLAYSTNGEAWTLVENSPFYPNAGISSIAYGGGKFVAFDEWGIVAYSEDGIEWTQSNRLLEDQRAIAYGGGRFIAVAGNGKIAYSNKME